MHSFRKYFENVQDQYDWILIDEPATDGILTANTALASDGHIVVTQPHQSNQNALKNIVNDLSELAEYNEHYMPSIFALIVNDIRPDNENQEQLQKHKDNFDGALFEVRHRVELMRAWKNQKSIFTHVNEKRGPCEMRENYREIANYLFELREGENQ